MAWLSAGLVFGLDSASEKGHEVGFGCRLLEREIILSSMKCVGKTNVVPFFLSCVIWLWFRGSLMVEPHILHYSDCMDGDHVSAHEKRSSRKRVTSWEDQTLCCLIPPDAYYPTSPLLNFSSVRRDYYHHRVVTRIQWVIFIKDPEWFLA